jgi:hypothetical protein
MEAMVVVSRLVEVSWGRRTQLHVLSESRPMRGVRGVDRQPCHGTPVAA